jgi:transposase-like protein
LIVDCFTRCRTPSLCRPPGLGQDREGSEAIYTAATEEAALERFAEFADAWGKKYLAIVKLWENAWEEFTPFLRFDTEIRRNVCTTNASESFNARPTRDRIVAVGLTTQCGPRR